MPYDKLIKLELELRSGAVEGAIKNIIAFTPPSTNVLTLITVTVAFRITKSLHHVLTEPRSHRAPASTEAGRAMGSSIADVSSAPTRTGSALSFGECFECELV